MAISRRRLPFTKELSLSISWMLILIVVEFINASLDHALNVFGILPRQTQGLMGIFISPILHSDSVHLVSNLLPLGIFMVLVMQHGIRQFWLATFVIIVIGGGLVWLLGRPAIHIGASGLLFGYFSFLIVAGIRSGDLKLIAISIAVGLGYGGIIFGVIPTQTLVSWEAHLYGLLAGILAAVWLSAKKT